MWSEVCNTSIPSYIKHKDSELADITEDEASKQTPDTPPNKQSKIKE
jgi:hypothetical protein